jgi:hypothetical protein
MPWCGRWALGTGDELEDGEKAVVDVVALGEVDALVERDPCSLVLAVAALNLLVCFLLNLALEDPGTCWLVEAGGLKDVGSVDPVVLSPAHDMLLKVIAKLVLVHGDLGEGGSAEGLEEGRKGQRQHTPL